jgi:O-antigen ligase
MSTRERPRDVFAFWLVVAFVVVMYSIPSSWIESLAEVRLALIASAGGAGLMLLRRLFKLEPVYFDGIRGFALLALGALAWASQSWSVNPEVTQVTSFELLKSIAIYLAIINVVTTPRRLVIVCAALVLSCMVTSIGAVNWYRAGVGLVEGFRTRWLGTFGDPNYLAMDIGLTVPLGVAFITHRSSAWLFRAICAIAVVLAVIAIVLSHSRGGFLGLCTAMAVWAFREKRRMQAIFLGIAFVIGLLLFAPATYWQRNETIREFHGEASAEGRVYAWELASKMSTDHPLLGVGAGGFRFAWPLYASGAQFKRPLVAHNVFLDVVAELGFVGLFLFLILAGGAVGGAFQASRDPNLAWLTRAIAASVTGYLVCQLFLSGYTLSPHLYVLFAVAASAERITRRRLVPMPQTSPIPSVASEPIGQRLTA